MGMIYLGLNSTDLRDTLPVLPSVKCCPSNATWVLALKEQTLGLAILESEDLAVSTDIKFALFRCVSAGVLMHRGIQLESDRSHKTVWRISWRKDRRRRIRQRTLPG